MHPHARTSACVRALAECVCQSWRFRPISFQPVSMVTSLWEQRRRRAGKGVETIIVVESAEKGRARECEQCEPRHENRVSWVSKELFVCVRLAVCILWLTGVLHGSLKVLVVMTTHIDYVKYVRDRMWNWKRMCFAGKLCHRAYEPTCIGFVCVCVEWEPHSESTGISNTM